MTPSGSPPSRNDPRFYIQRAPRPPFVPQPYRFGGWVLAGLVAFCILCFWLLAMALSGGDLDASNPTTWVLVGGSWLLLFVDRPGFASFAGRIPWNTLSTGKQFWLICGFLLAPEFLLAVYLWMAVKDHLRARSTTLRHEAGASWGLFRGLSRLLQVGLVAAVLVGMVVVYALSSASYANGQAAKAALLASYGSTSGQAANQGVTSSGNGSGQLVQVAAPTATDIPTATAAPPTATPVSPTATPKPAPTNPPAPTGVNGNPWGYEFTSGSYIYSPPSNFCDYFTCIKSFSTSTNGYVEECQDGDYSHSGGRSGSCSDHGGNWRPLLQP